MVGLLHTLWHHPKSKKRQLFQGPDKKRRVRKIPWVAANRSGIKYRLHTDIKAEKSLQSYEEWSSGVMKWPKNESPE